MISRIQLRRGTAAAWVSSNPVLGSGEPGYETDTGKFKIGDGATAWNDLDYASGGGGGGDLVAADITDSTAAGRSVVTTTAKFPVIGINVGPAGSGEVQGYYEKIDQTFGDGTKPEYRNGTIYICWNYGGNQNWSFTDGNGGNIWYFSTNDVPTPDLCENWGIDTSGVAPAPTAVTPVYGWPQDAGLAVLGAVTPAAAASAIGAVKVMTSNTAAGDITSGSKWVVYENCAWAELQEASGVQITNLGIAPADIGGLVTVGVGETVVFSFSSSPDPTLTEEIYRGAISSKPWFPVVVAGAGTPEANGTYSLDGVFNGRQRYTKIGGVTGHDSIIWDIDLWALYSNESRLYYGKRGATPDIGEWGVDQGIPDPPTVTSPTREAALGALGGAAASHTQAASTISDSTAAGRSIVTTTAVFPATGEILVTGGEGVYPPSITYPPVAQTIGDGTKQEYRYPDSTGYIVWNYNSSGKWQILDTGDGGAYYESSNDVPTPDLCTTWVLGDLGQGAIPTVTAVLKTPTDTGFAVLSAATPAAAASAIGAVKVMTPTTSWADVVAGSKWIIYESCYIEAGLNTRAGIQITNLGTTAVEIKTVGSDEFAQALIGIGAGETVIFDESFFDASPPNEAWDPLFTETYRGKIGVDADGATPIGPKARLLPFQNGVKLQVSADGVTWQDKVNYQYV